MNTVRDEKLNYSSDFCCVVSWSSVVAGALVAFSLSALLNMLNAGLGLVTFLESFRSVAGVAAGGYIWLVICGIVAMFIAGWVAGKIARHRGACYGALHGFLAWSLALLFTVMMAVHVVNRAAEPTNRAADRTDSARMLELHEPVNAEQAADMAGTATIGLFFIFLIGAASASLGGYMGARKGHFHSHHDDSHTGTHTHTTKY